MLGRLFIILLAALLGACDSAPPAADVTRINLPTTGIQVVGENFDSSLKDWQFFDGTWEHLDDQGNGTLTQTADHLGRRMFPLALWKQHRFTDTDVSVRFKTISGEMDASGGLVFRAHDGDNYYIARANSLEDNIRLYKFTDGNRSRIAGATLTPPALGQWHTLRVVALGTQIQVYLNDTLYIDHRDETLTAGYVGLWTKADAVTAFDDLTVRGIPTDTQ